MPHPNIEYKTNTNYLTTEVGPMIKEELLGIYPLLGLECSWG